jgi:hypothetical protein
MVAALKQQQRPSTALPHPRHPCSTAILTALPAWLHWSEALLVGREQPRLPSIHERARRRAPTPRRSHELDRGWRQGDLRGGAMWQAQRIGDCCAKNRPGCAANDMERRGMERIQSSEPSHQIATRVFQAAPAAASKCPSTFQRRWTTRREQRARHESCIDLAHIGRLLHWAEPAATGTSSASRLRAECPCGRSRARVRQHRGHLFGRHI